MNTNPLPPSRWNESKRRAKELAECDHYKEQTQRQLEWDDAMSNGCTAVPDFNFRHCCVQHDKAYYFGGGFFSRWKADWALKNCIRAAGHPILCWTYFLGVRVFGRFFYTYRISSWITRKENKNGKKEDETPSETKGRCGDCSRNPGER